MTKRRQFSLLPDAPKAPRKKPRVMGHLCDCGAAPNGDEYTAWICGKCGHEWSEVGECRSVTENRRGRPCPECNP